MKRLQLLLDGVRIDSTDPKPECVLCWADARESLDLVGSGGALLAMLASGETICERHELIVIGFIERARAAVAQTKAARS